MTQAMPLVTGDDPVKNNMIDLVTEMARALVDSPESVSVIASNDGDGTVLRLHVAATDVGKVIGKQGRTSNSLRTVLSAVGMKLQKRYGLDIKENS